jgi:U5 snRNP spliceosome subunit
LTDKPKKLVPALVGGVVLAALSSIPFVSLANVACCSWAIVGGGVAAYMLVKRSSMRRVTSGDGALVGLLAGLIGSLAILLINIPFAKRFGPEFIAGMRQAAEQQKDPQAQETINRLIAFMQDSGLLAVLMIWLVFTLIAVGMATLGGIIGVAIFEKRKGNQPPPTYPPPDYPPPGYGPPGYGPPPGPPPNQPPY